MLKVIVRLKAARETNSDQNKSYAAGWARTIQAGTTPVLFLQQLCSQSAGCYNKGIETARR